MTEHGIKLVGIDKQVNDVRYTMAAGRATITSVRIQSTGQERVHVLNDETMKSYRQAVESIHTGDLEDGSACPIEGCEGRLHIGEVEGCSCIISPPCSACVDNPLVCDFCYEPAELNHKQMMAGNNGR